MSDAAATESMQDVEEVRQRATTQLEELERHDEEALVLWDESVLEKPESMATSDLGSGAVQQSPPAHPHQARVHQPPSRPIFVPGFQWIGLLLAGMSGTLRLTALHRWINRRSPLADSAVRDPNPVHSPLAHLAQAGRWRRIMAARLAARPREARLGSPPPLGCPASQGSGAGNPRLRSIASGTR